MADYLSAGVYIEEVANAAQNIEAVTSSTMGIVGWTPEGPVDEATLVTSPQAYSRAFGGNTADSLVPLSVSAYFNNGGTRVYVVRVVPSDAATALIDVPGTITSEAYGTGTTGLSPQTKAHTLAYAPTPGTVVLSWTQPGVPIAAEATTWVGAGDPQLPVLADGAVVHTLVSHPVTTGDTITLSWTIGAGARTCTIDSAGVFTPSDALSMDAATATIDRATGEISIHFLLAVTVRPTVAYIPIGTPRTATDVPAGLTGAFPVALGISSSLITYSTGAVTVTWTSAASPLQVPYNGCPITVTYTGRQWRFNAANDGAWGNDLKVTLAGNENFMVYAPHTTTGAGTFTKYDVTVSRLNPDTSLYETQETYEELSFTDASDAMYAPDVINDASDLVELVDYGYLDVPSTFKGVSIVGENTHVPADGPRGISPTPNAALTAFTYTVPGTACAIVKGSLQVNVTDAIGSYVATADAAGIITGTRIDTTKTNTIDWATGNITLNFSNAPLAPAGAPPLDQGLSFDYIKYPTTPYVDYTLATGADGTLNTITRSRVSLYSALKTTRQGLYAFDRIDEILNIVLPDWGGDVNVQSDMVDYCDNRRDCFTILSTPDGMSAAEAVDWNRITFNKKSKYAAVYWPWVNVADPLADNRALLVPPVAHVAGIYARTDQTKNVGKAPAGTVDGALRGVMSLEMNPGKDDRDLVYPARINPLINTPQTGMCVWGARTVSATSDVFKWVNAVRLFLYVEKSVFNSTHGFVFENITNNLYVTIKGALDSFLLNLFNQGYFAGSTTSQAFSVVCDASNNPASVVNAGQVVVDVAIAPNRPGEFIRFKFAAKSIT